MTAVATTLSVVSVSIDLGDYAMKRIDYRVRRLSEAFRLSDEQAEDIGQDMAVELLRALPRFDAVQCKRKTFVTRILDLEYKRHARDLAARRRHRSWNPKGLNDIAEGFEPLCNDPASGELSDVDTADLRLDLAQLMATMPKRLCDVIAALLENDGDVAQATRALGKHRSNVLRAIDDVREHLVAAGYGEEFSAVIASKSTHAQK